MGDTCSIRWQLHIHLSSVAIDEGKKQSLQSIDSSRESASLNFKELSLTLGG